MVVLNSLIFHADLCGRESKPHQLNTLESTSQVETIFSTCNTHVPADPFDHPRELGVRGEGDGEESRNREW